MNMHAETSGQRDEARATARPQPPASGSERTGGEGLAAKMAAIQIAHIWLARERMKRELAACTGFASAPIFRGESGKAFYPDRAEFTDAALFAFLKGEMLRVLTEEARQLYETLTGAFKVPPATLTLWRDEMLGKPDREGDHEMKPPRDIAAERDGEARGEAA